MPPRHIKIEKRNKALAALIAKRLKALKPITIKTVSVAEVMAAGGPTEYAMTKGVNPKTAKVSGWVRISRAETDRMLEMLRRMG